MCLEEVFLVFTFDRTRNIFIEKIVKNHLDRLKVSYVFY